MSFSLTSLLKVYLIGGITPDPTVNAIEKVWMGSVDTNNTPTQLLNKDGSLMLPLPSNSLSEGCAVGYFIPSQTERVVIITGGRDPTE